MPIHLKHAYIPLANLVLPPSTILRGDFLYSEIPAPSPAHTDALGALISELDLLRYTLGQNLNFPYQKMTNKLSRKLQELMTISWLENDRET
jgi:hypothetical protein